MHQPSRDAMYAASVAVLSAASQLTDGALPPADVLREQMVGLLRDFVARGRAAGIPDQEVAEARYALVAFIDDRVLKSTWPGRAEWQSNPLQLQYYREFTAGENFFARMRALIQRGGPVLPLEVYYLCLALGFAGALPGASGPQAARPFLDSARGPLLQGCTPDRIAPNAIPSERHPARPRPFPVGVATAVACAIVGLLALVGLDASLHHVLARTAARLSAATTSQVTTPGASK